MDEEFRFDKTGHLIRYQGPDFNWLAGTVLRNAIRPVSSRQRTEINVECSPFPKLPQREISPRFTSDG